MFGPPAPGEEGFVTNSKQIVEKIKSGDEKIEEQREEQTAEQIEEQIIGEQRSKRGTNGWTNRKDLANGKHHEKIEKNRKTQETRSRCDVPQGRGSQILLQEARLKVF